MKQSTMNPNKARNVESKYGSGLDLGGNSKHIQTRLRRTYRNGLRGILGAAMAVAMMVGCMLCPTAHAQSSQGFTGTVSVFANLFR